MQELNKNQSSMIDGRINNDRQNILILRVNFLICSYYLFYYIIIIIIIALCYASTHMLDMDGIIWVFTSTPPEIS